MCTSGPPRPPWADHRRGPWHKGPMPPEWRRHRGWVFVRLVLVFGFFALLLFGGLALLTGLVIRLAGGDRRAAALLWLSTCGLLVFLPMVVGFVGRRAFRNFAVPLADLMNAAERVAEGDLSVRVAESSRGEFRQLSTSFNHMVEELALADQRRRNLTADVAHELRTPLQVIQGNLEGVLDGVYAPTPEHIGATLEETKLLARLVEDLRVLSQAEAGQLPMQWEPVDVAELVADVATSFSGQAQAAGVALQTDIAAGAPVALPAALVIRGDYSRLDQVLGNLTANALRHTPPGGAVTLRAGATADGVRLEVADTGEGIAPAELPYIFDRFWRGDRARTHGKGAGSGLGLAIARQFVQAHGGRIDVASAPGEGATFVIELPRGTGDGRQVTGDR